MGEKYQYEYTELKIKILIGGVEYTRLIPNFTLTSRRDSPVRLLEFELGNVKSPAQGGLYSGVAGVGIPVELYWGLDDDIPKIFAGEIVDSNDTKSVHAWVVDKSANLKRIISEINTTDEKTSQIVKRLAGEAKLGPEFLVSNAFDVTFPHWCCAGETIQEALTRLSTSLQESFGKDIRDVKWWYDRKARFHWGAWSDGDAGRNEIEKDLVLSHKENIISLHVPKRKGDIGEVITHAWPYFDHSQEIKIIDERLAKVNTKYRTEEVRHIQTGFRARTQIFFREID